MSKSTPARKLRMRRSAPVLFASDQMQGIPPPHSLFAAAKRERAVEPSKRKNAGAELAHSRKFA